MRITHCLMSSDSNPEYLDFWPVVAKAWLKLDIRPVLFYIQTDKNRHPEQIADCPVHILEPIPDISIKIQASSLRYWGCCYYPDNIVVISDIDLIPLSREFFIDRLREADDDSYIHIPPVRSPFPNASEAERKAGYRMITSDAILRDYPIERATWLNAVYHVARGETMRRVLELSDSWEGICRKMVPYWYKIGRYSSSILPYGHVRTPGQTPYFGDEIYHSIRAALAQPRERIVLMPYNDDEFTWLCRAGTTSVGVSLSDYDEAKLRSGYYSALHAPRPYSKHKAAIDRLLELNASPHASA